MKNLSKAQRKTAAPGAGKAAAPLFVSPSAWMVWEKCALSLQAVKSPLVLERAEYAKEGTRLHGILADTLRDPAFPAPEDDPVVPPQPAGLTGPPRVP